MGKESACNAGDAGSSPMLGRSPGVGSGNPLQYSCMENPMDRGAWKTTVHRVAKSWTRLKWLSTHIQGPEAICSMGNCARWTWFSKGVEVPDESWRSRRKNETRPLLVRESLFHTAEC